MIWTKDFATFEEFTPPVHYPVTFPPPLFDGIIKITNLEQQLAKGLIGKAGVAIAKHVAGPELIVKAAGRETLGADKAVVLARRNRHRRSHSGYLATSLPHEEVAEMTIAAALK
jgi:hypothetical protein